jgi:hypothetical protein
MNWLRWIKPKVLVREPLVLVRRAWDSITVAMDAAVTAIMSTRTQTSLVAVRSISPRNGIRAVGFVERHRTER